MGDHGQVGRLGGDEFKAVLPGTVDIGFLEPLARTLIEQVSRPYMIEGHRVTIGASVGIAIGDPGRACADSLIRNADLALYAAKAAGRGKHCFYEPAMHSDLSDRQVLENDLRQAIERGELWVAYQPIVRAAGEEICGFEALVRWDHPVRGPISPDKFIPLAEECGLISEHRRVGAQDRAAGSGATGPTRCGSRSTCRRSSSTTPAIVDVDRAAAQGNRRCARSGSSSRSPRACSSPRATAPTTPSPGSRISASGSRSTISAPATARSAI